MRIHIIVILCVCVCNLNAERITTQMLTTSWPGGYHAILHIPVQQSVQDWTLNFVFDKPVHILEIWKSDIVSNTDTHWNTHSKPDVEASLAGQDLVVEINVRYDGDPLILGSYNFNVVSYATTTATPTTEAPTTTTTTTTTTTSPNTSQPISGTDKVHGMHHNYTEALRLSTEFYNAQRSGQLPANNPIPWRGDSALNDSDNGHDLTGGWYNGGDHVKFNMPMSFSTWLLEWGILEFSKAYLTNSQTTGVCDMIKWPLDYFLNCWIPDEHTLYVQVGDTNTDHAYWGPPENMTINRPAFKVTPSCRGSDVAADTVSALAAGFLVFRYACANSRYSFKLLNAAESLYEFSKNNRGIYSDCITRADHSYDSSGDEDELATAAAWMYKATNDAKYLHDAQTFYKPNIPWDFSWTDTNIATALLLYDITKDDVYKNDIEGFIEGYMSNMTYTPCGLVWIDQWGPNRYAANAAFIALLAANKGINPDMYKSWAMSQINYLLGDNKMNMSYEVGYGEKYPLQPHHRGSSCSGTSDPCMYLNPNNNPNILSGALVGGPDVNGNYLDKRSNYVQNEIALDFNAGFQSALAGLVYFSDINELPQAQMTKC